MARVDEIAVAIAVTSGGRPHPRVGGLTVAGGKVYVGTTNSVAVFGLLTH